MADRPRAVDSPKIWTALITNMSYLPGLLTLHHSLAHSPHRSAYPLLALHTDGFPAEGLRALARRGIAAQRIEYVTPRDAPEYAADVRFRDCWTKLAPFAMVEYERVVQLDCDMLVVRNMDELMELELDGDPDSDEGDDDDGGQRVLAAGHACVCNPLGKEHYPRDWTAANCAFTRQHADADAAQRSGGSPTLSPLGYLNGGLQVVRPSLRRWADIRAHMEAHASAMDFADQSVLSELYAGRWVALPYVYNALKSLRWEGVHAEIWRDEEVRNVHYILAPKPWEEKEGGRRDRVLLGWWWRMDGERRRMERERGVDDGW